MIAMTDGLLIGIRFRRIVDVIGRRRLVVEAFLDFLGSEWK